MATFDELIEEHCGDLSYETNWAFSNLPHKKELFYGDDNKRNLVGVAAYFPLERLHFDMVVMLHKDNRFSFSQWRWLKNVLKYRTKPIKIQITDNEGTLERFAKRYGGYLEGPNILVFPSNKEKDYNKWH